MIRPPVGVNTKTQCSPAACPARRSRYPMRMSDRPSPDRRLAVAPMLDWTDRWCRYFLRQISRHTLLYTEMVTTGALLHRDPARFLDHHPHEHPLALQLGGSEPEALERCARLAADWGYDELNLNVGCPSDRVSSGRFGACLMAEPERVAECVAAMRQGFAGPVTVKHRIGIDDRDAYEDMACFVERVAAAGCTTFIVHARKAWLSGLSPRENREIPPLRHAEVHRLKRDFPGLEIVINGGIGSLDEAQTHLRAVDGVMIGRAVYHDPWLLADADRRVFGADLAPASRHAVVRGMRDFIEAELAAGTRLHHITRHMLGLFNGLPGARHWRRHLSEHANRADAGWHTVEQALAGVREPS